MRPFARHGARLASSSRARQPSVPRAAATERQFHTSRSVASENRPPNGPAENPNHTPFNERREEHKKHDNTPTKSEQETETETENGGNRNDHFRPGTKRFLRGKRKPNPPEPPRVPDWFLRHNVKLLKDSPGMGVSEDRGQVIRCVDAETGHTLFDVPYYEAWPPAAEANAKGKKSSLQKDFFDSRVKFEETKDESKKDSADLKLQAPETADAWKNNQMRWVFLEADTSARAAFALNVGDQRSYSVMTNRVDLSLQCPDDNSHDQMDEFVRDLARVVQADIVRLDANDFSELAEDYVDQGHDGPGTYAHMGYDVFQNRVASSVRAKDRAMFNPFEQHEDENEMDEEEEEDEDEHDFGGHGNNIGSRLENIKQALMGKMGHRIIGIGVGVPPQIGQMGSGTPFSESQSRPSNRVFQEASTEDHPRIGSLLDSLMDAPKYKHSSDSSAEHTRRAERRKSGGQKGSDADADPGRDYQRILRHWRANPALWLPQVAKSLVSYLSGASSESEPAKSTFKLTSSAPRKKSQSAESGVRRRTIVHVRDLRDMANTRLGEAVIQKLCMVVQKRRRNGEQIMVVGTTAQDTIGPVNLPGDSSHLTEFPLRSITVPPFFNLSMGEVQKLEAGSPALESGTLEKPAYRRIMEINLRHVQSMLRRLRPEDNIDLYPVAYEQLNLPGMRYLTERTLAADQIQRLVLVAIGLSQTHAKSEKVKPIHLALASFITTRSDLAVRAWSEFNQQKQTKRVKINLGERPESSTESPTEQPDGSARIEKIKKSCNPHETRLLSGVVDPTNIKTTFSEVHAQPETINALKDLTTLSLLRPEAFKYGVLASDRLPGLLLYGPPGTGKTLLAKAVAKESKATVLEVSGAQIYEKYVGEGEKMVRAVFSLAKKLSPCVVFIDEADAIFGSRSNSGGNRNTHREIINQFLREWDGMDDHGCFMMVASNRPFDLDDAVLRRLPRRLLVDLPVEKDRESILGIHLKNETLDSSVSLAKLAEQTPLYSGSDLKNLSVAAALACVREENELASQNREDKEFKLPEKRTLLPRHFDKALAEISASISEDMASLAAIRKFDEQYGDRKGRRKKTNYGFGMGDGGVDESAVRVRSGMGPPPS